MTCTKPQFPHVEVQLTGEDGNIFFIMGRVASAMRRAGVPKEDIEAYRAEVLASESYDAALRATMRTVRVL